MWIWYEIIMQIKTKMTNIDNCGISDYCVIILTNNTMIFGRKNLNGMVIFGRRGQ